jgi:transglutaminase-like putative cysteine protease
MTSSLANMTAYRVTKEVALAPAGEISQDFGLKTLVKIDKQIPNPLDATEIVYRVRIKDDSPEKIFPTDERQSLAMNDDGQWLMTIRAIDPGNAARAAANNNLAEFLRPNNWLQSDHPRVAAAAKQAIANASDSWEKARRIERWVFENIKQKNFSTAFESAAVVAEKLEGDCTEHGVLVAAMARAAGIPSRVATGLVYAQRLGAFGFHMWAEVHVAGHWIPLDGTLGLGHASPTHIKLSDSSLDGVDATTVLLPVLQVMDRLKIEVVSWKHKDAS